MSFLKKGAFDAQNLITIPLAKLRSASYLQLNSGMSSELSRRGSVSTHEHWRAARSSLKATAVGFADARRLGSKSRYAEGFSSAE